MTESQRAMVGAKLADMTVGKPNPANLQNNTSRAQAAEMLNVSERSVNTAKKVERQGAPELVEAVEQGKVSVSAAADVAELPKEEQTEVVAENRMKRLDTNPLI